MTYSLFLQTALTSFVLLSAIACGVKEPVATRYKNERQAIPVNPIDDGDLETSEGSSTSAPADEAQDDSANNEDNTDEAANDADDESQESGDNQTPDEQEADAQAQLVQMGTEIYGNRCANCHGAVAMSEKSGRTADQILGAAGEFAHMNVQWPNQQEADALAAALAQ
jgi:cytochrome c5